MDRRLSHPLTTVAATECGPDYVRVKVQRNSTILLSLLYGGHVNQKVIHPSDRQYHAELHARSCVARYPRYPRNHLEWLDTHKNFLCTLQITGNGRDNNKIVKIQIFKYTTIFGKEFSQKRTRTIIIIIIIIIMIDVSFMRDEVSVFTKRNSL